MLDMDTFDTFLITLYTYEGLDRLGVATRWPGRRGVGWLPEYADRAPCARLGRFPGFRVLTAVSQNGFITGSSPVHHRPSCWVSADWSESARMIWQDLPQFTARLSAKVGLHSFCCGLNQQGSLPLLAFADLIDW